MKKLEDTFESLYYILVDYSPSEFMAIAANERGCFRTEVRDSGTFICGVHQSELWKDPRDSCPEIYTMMDFMARAIGEVERKHLAAMDRQSRNS